MTDRVLHFTLGPVQGFIADARRLRDYWAGSFILSLLSGHAMVAAKKVGAEIVFPEVATDELFQAIESKDRSASVYIGSLPNRFKADCTAVSNSIDVGETCKTAVLAAWDTICDTIWAKYIAGSANQKTRQIWKRQTSSFWDMAWADGSPSDLDGRWLDTRKNWRRIGLVPDAAEGGDHCRLMGDFQELSGIERFSDDQRNSQIQFWRSVREGSGIGLLDLPEGEFLCALAFIKRVFPVHLDREGGRERDDPDGPSFFRAIPWRPGGTNFNVRYWPATSYVAALPWLKTAEQKLSRNDEAASLLYRTARQVLGTEQGILGETSTTFFANSSPPLFALDGHLLHTSGIESLVKERFADEQTEKGEATSTLHQALRETCLALSDGKRPVYPSGFYAVLRMDGDGVGRLLDGNEDTVRNGLAKFTDRVKKYFDNQSENSSLGTLVYAGGDDVLAVLPVDSAIQAARDIRDQYTEAFDGDAKFTLSGSIVFAHFKHPLTAVLRHSSELLDSEAKEKNGRNSLAISIFKPGGESARWASVFGEDAGKDDYALTIQQVAETGLPPNADPLVSGGFFHRFRDRYMPVISPDVTDDENYASIWKVFDDETSTALRALIGAELRRQFGSSVYANFDLHVPGSAIDTVYRVLTPKLRFETVGGTYDTRSRISFDGGLVARFLAMEGRRLALDPSAGEGKP
ncbi:MAG: type III-B CRISPR-associated protein Cas10/Cmr2 [Hyphomicrobiales bacterium]